MENKIPFCYVGVVFDYVILFCVFVYVDIQRSREENSLYQCWTTIKCIFFFLPNDLPTEAGVHQVLFLASLSKPCDVRNGTDTSSQFLTISPSMF